MRQRFEQQTSLKLLPISEVRFPLKSRDELPPVLMALQYIFVTPELNEKIFKILEEKICKGKQKTGRKGMDLWHILVLGVVRHARGMDWDQLDHAANYDELVRKVMGVHATSFITEDDRIEFGYQTILDNVSLLDEETLQQINQLIVEAGHSILKKKEEESLVLKTDSYVVECDVHFPTDLNLLWDSLRKCLDVVGEIKKLVAIKGWRKINHLRSALKSTFRAASFQVFKGRKEEAKIKKVTEYLIQAQRIIDKVTEVLNRELLAGNQKALLLTIDLKRYQDYAIKHIDLVDRRILKGEVIPADDKIYSIFEDHTEWISKGKLNKKVELGHMVLITSDQHQFIVDYKVMNKQKDPQQVPSLIERLEQKFPTTSISSISMDKGFYSKGNLQVIENSKIEKAILPKKGKLNEQEKITQSEAEFVRLRHKHSAVESNINMLEHHGLGRCYDKGMKGFKRCVGLSVLAYNIHILGNALKAKEIAEKNKRQKAKIKRAA